MSFATHRRVDLSSQSTSYTLAQTKLQQYLNLSARIMLNNSSRSSFKGIAKQFGEKAKAAYSNSHRQLHSNTYHTGTNVNKYIRTTEIGKSLSSHQRIRCQGFSSYEYPTRTEAPQVTRTLASDLPDISEDDGAPSSKKYSSMPTKSSSVPDPFDDMYELTSPQRAETLQHQTQNLSTNLDPKHKITTQVPANIPPNYPPTQLSIPSVELTSLPSSLRVASQETYGQVSTVGLLCDFGSRYETPQNTGVNHLIELMAFQSTSKYPSASHIVEKMDNLGGSTFASSSREQMLYCVDILRPNVDQAMELLAETVLHPNIHEMEIQEMKQVMQFQHEEWHGEGGIGSEVALGEGIQLAAYGKTSEGKSQQQLGKVHFCPPESLHNLTAETIHQFRMEHLTPNRTVIAGAGIEHDHLLDLTNTYFSSFFENAANKDPTPRVNSIYTGGEYRHILPSLGSPLQMHSMHPESLTRVALAFEIPKGWSSQDLVPACVLQTLLGGGNSFSAGGPGKGMYSRLYREILNRFYWAESAEAFTAFHAESGLLGMSGSTYNPQKVRDLVRVLAEHFAKLAMTDVSIEELSRAKNMLRCNVLTQLESRLVLFEDIGRQILTYGKRENVKSMCDKIDAVTHEDIRRLAKMMVSKPPTLCIVGGEQEVQTAHSWDEVNGWFAGL